MGAGTLDAGRSGGLPSGGEGVVPKRRKGQSSVLNRRRTAKQRSRKASVRSAAKKAEEAEWAARSGPVVVRRATDAGEAS